ncbi:MAG: dienelactone hydrolase family protein [Bacteroidales bacterium]|nr:dienelactone hydrolase family protein [Bacteroidales bacterium]
MLALLLILLQMQLPLWQAVKPDVQVLESEDRGGYSCSLIEYAAVGAERVQAYLLVPHGASAGKPAPGLVLLHDHGARFDIGKEKLVRPLDSAPEYIKSSASEWVGRGFDGVFFGDRLASLGYVVIVPDALYWGSRRSAACTRWSEVKFGGADGDLKLLKTEVYEGQRAVYDSLQRRGVVWAEQTLNEDAAAARLLGALPYVSGVGCFGWSMGAHRAWLLAAFCPEVSCGAAVSWMTLKDSGPLTPSDYSMIIPQLRDKYDFPDIAYALAPKPFFFLSGTEDHLFPPEKVREAYSAMRRIYEDGAASGELRTAFFEGGHHCGAEEQRSIEKFFGEIF